MHKNDLQYQLSHKHMCIW